MDTEKQFSKEKVGQDSEFDTLSEMPDFDEREKIDEAQEKLDKFEKFFDNDVRVKELLMETAPTDMDNFDEESRVKYSDKLFDNYGEMMRNLSEMMDGYYQSKEIEETLVGITDDIMHAGADFGKMSRIYKEKMAGMSEEFVEGVHNETQGYYIFRSPHMMDKKATSVNEILHLIHSSVVNNEGFLEELPELKNDGEVTLRGVENEVAEEIFQELTEKGVDVGTTDIVGLKDRVLMMVRDRGHALTMDVQKDRDGRCYVDYFIPKICNVEMVNSLPGVRKVESMQGTTSGVFQVEDNTAKEVVDFIGRVPMDSDMPMWRE